jgi:GNAT superfamily N-acetyltransferase
MYACAPPGIGAGARQIGGGLCIRLDSMPDFAVFNRAMGLGLDEPSTEELVEAVLEFLEGTRSYVSVSPEARPPELAGWLQERGLEPGYGWTKFVGRVSVSRESPTTLRIERVESGEAFGAAVAGGFEMPDVFRDWLTRLPGRKGWHCFVGFEGDEPAGAGALYVTGKIGWLGIGATLPEHRGKGAQSAIIARRIEAAAKLGCDVVVSETGKPVDGAAGASYRNLVRAGLEPVYVRPSFQRAVISGS